MECGETPEGDTLCSCGKTLGSLGRKDSEVRGAGPSGLDHLLGVTGRDFPPLHRGLSTSTLQTANEGTCATDRNAGLNVC